ncbi:MAG: 3'-5'-exoribonuclease [Pycnora praestabilis]|nr:MAG: 3'-5'-exoribonuclease [Pycnora praestabilis]
MTDRRRINGPSGGTAPLVFDSSIKDGASAPARRPSRTRQPNDLRKIFLRTGLTPSASGSAYLELDASSMSNAQRTSLIAPSSALKLTCTVHGPRPLPRSAPFSPHIILSTTVKFAPFAARQRRGYIRDASERDLAVHLETALRGVIIGDRWPKSGVEVVITVLEGEEDRWWGNEAGGGTSGLGGVGGWGMMTVLAGCITAASAAITDAGIDCVDLVTGGVAAIVGTSSQIKDKQGQVSRSGSQDEKGGRILVDPSPSEHENVVAACVVGYLSSRDEITELWVKGDIPSENTNMDDRASKSRTLLQELMDQAVDAASGARLVLAEAVKEATELKLRQSPSTKQTTPGSGPSENVTMAS